MSCAILLRLNNKVHSYYSHTSIDKYLITSRKIWNKIKIRLASDKKYGHDVTKT